MSEEFINVLVFVLVFIVVPWGFIFGLRLLGRRRGYESQFAPQEEPPADRPLRCRLNLFHRWRTMRTRPATATSAASTAGGLGTSRWWAAALGFAAEACARQRAACVV
jgi:hypothetical protein